MKRLFLFHLLLIFSQGISAQTFVGLSDSIKQGDFGNLNAVVISHHGGVKFDGGHDPQTEWYQPT